ncbi:hypothetical protein J4471_02600 [Candidatus Woesearchaeota archaeon]|nr:hypothetical protein [Candidatus Woesearchaeota archaeon]
MSNKILAIIIILVLFGGTFAAFQISSRKKVSNVQNEIFNFESIEGPGDITLTLKPKDYNNNLLNIEISVNTHSIELSTYDLQDLVNIQYKGNRIKPISAPNLQGHHGSGSLIFNIDEKPANYNFIVEGFNSIA